MDLLAHGDTEIRRGSGRFGDGQCQIMLGEFLDALKIDQVDLVGNDSGGGIAQIFAALYPERVAQPHADQLRRARQLAAARPSSLSSRWRPPAGCAEHWRRCCPTRASIARRRRSDRRTSIRSGHGRHDRTLSAAVGRTEQRTRDLARFLAAFDNQHTVAIEAQLKTLKAPTLIVWGTDDVYFDVKWSRWLADTIPGTRRRVEFKGARIFFPEERWAEFIRSFAHIGTPALSRRNPVDVGSALSAASRWWASQFCRMPGMREAPD